MRTSSTWYERSQRVSWDIFYTPLGGRLRSEKNLTVDDLSGVNATPEGVIHAVVKIS